MNLSGEVVCAYCSVIMLLGFSNLHTGETTRRQSSCFFSTKEINPSKTRKNSPTQRHTRKIWESLNTLKIRRTWKFVNFVGAKTLKHEYFEIWRFLNAWNFEDMEIRKIRELWNMEILKYANVETRKPWNLKTLNVKIRKTLKFEKLEVENVSKRWNFKIR